MAMTRKIFEQYNGKGQMLKCWINEDTPEVYIITGSEDDETPHNLWTTLDIYDLDALIRELKELRKLM